MITEAILVVLFSLLLADDYLSLAKRYSKKSELRKNAVIHGFLFVLAFYGCSVIVQGFMETQIEVDETNLEVTPQRPIRRNFGHLSQRALRRLEALRRSAGAL